MQQANASPTTTAKCYKCNKPASIKLEMVDGSRSITCCDEHSPFGPPADQPESDVQKAARKGFESS